VPIRTDARSFTPEALREFYRWSARQRKALNLPAVSRRYHVL
jgi:hypothetical protein